MPLLRKVLFNLTILALFLVAFYYYQTSDGGRWIVPNSKARNESLANLTTTLAVVSYTAKVNYSSSTVDSSSRNRRSYYNVWCIFTKVTSNSPMRRKFQIFTDSLLRLTTVNIAFHVISDDDSQSIAETVIQNVMASTGKFMKVCLLFSFSISYESSIFYELNYPGSEKHCI